MLKSRTDYTKRGAAVFIAALLTTAACAENVAPLPAEPAPLRFDIGSYSAEGATLLTPAEIGAAVAPFTGKSRDFSDVQNALEALQAAYVKRGYTAVQVMLPEQKLENGRIRFRVVESRYGQITVKGQKNVSEQNVLNAIPSVRPGNVPRTGQIAREFRLANENPARNLTFVLKAGKQENEVNADVLVTDANPVQWGASFDNTGSVETGHTRLGLTYRHANLFDADHVGTLQLQMSPQQPSRVRVFGGGYKIPLYASGDSVELFAGYSNVNSLVGGLTNFRGGGQLLNIHYNHPLERRAGFDPRLTYGFDWRDFKRIEQAQPGPVVLFNEVVVTPLSLGLAAQDKAERSDTNLDINFAANLPLGGKGNNAAFANYDPLGSIKPDARYRIVHFGASHMQTAGADWQLRGALAGQWTRNVLVLGEQMRLGGMDAVRGFSEGAEAGESGTRWTLEGYSPNVNLSGINSRSLLFFDGGNVRSHSGVHSSIRSAGLGMRANWQQVSFRLDAGRIVKAGNDPLQKAGDWRLHAAVAASF